MKLKMTQIAQTDITMKLVSDPYICVDVLIGEPDKVLRISSPMYWRFVEGNKNLITIGLNPFTGLLCSITVMYYPPIKPVEIDKTTAVAVVEHVGLPQFNLDVWQPISFSVDDYHRTFYEVEGKCTVQLTADGFCLTLFEDEVSHVVAYQDRLLCQFNKDDELCGIVFAGFSPAEMNDIRDWWGPPPPNNPNNAWVDHFTPPRQAIWARLRPFGKRSDAKWQWPWVKRGK